MILLFYILAAACTVSQAGHVYYQQGKQYNYHYDGFTDIEDVGRFHVNAQAMIIPLSGMVKNSTQHCSLIVNHLNIIVNRNEEVYQPHWEGITYDKWLSFYLSHHGEVESVFIEADENPMVLSLKKVLLSALSSRLIVSEEQMQKQKRWGYQASEKGHHGEHASIYKAEPDGASVMFTKTLTSRAMDNAPQKHEKIIHLTDNIPDKIIVTESFSSPNSPMQGYHSSVPETSKALNDANADIGLPSMSGYSSLSLTLDTVTHYSSDDYNGIPNALINSTLEIGNIPLPILSMKDHEVQASIHGNITCIQHHETSGLQSPTGCFTRLTNILERLPESDLITVFLKYVSDTLPVEVHHIIVDALGASATNATWTVLTKLVLRGDNMSAELVMRTLVQFVGTEKFPPKILLDTLEEFTTTQRYHYEDPIESDQVNSRVLLVLGSVVHTMKAANPEWSQRIMRQMETNLGVHDPFNHRGLREAMSYDELQDHVHNKALRLLMMGNARMDSSLPYLHSYLNDTEAHVLLKCAAVEALGNFGYKEVAEKLLGLALTDHEDNVRLVALNKYKRHPHGGDVQAVLDDKYQNNTSLEHVRVKRNLKQIIARIFQGFEFHLESPGVDWRKAIGGSSLGASFGLVIRNMLDINIKPLEGGILLDIYDTAFATIHMGMLGFDINVLKAELCFKATVTYNLNILAEYGFDDVEKFKELYENVVVKVYENIKSGVEDFQSVMTSFEEYQPKEIFGDLIESLEDMFNKVFNLKQTGRRILKALKEYTNMPPVVREIEKLVKKIIKLFADVKNDVMKLYNSIVDGVTVTLPWAWSEIQTAFNAIGKSIQSILKDPKGSIKAIGEIIARISLAVTTVIDVKDKIVQANIFNKDNRPYWFDVTEVFEDLKHDILTIKESVTDTIQWLKTDPADNAKAIEFTGMDIDSMKKAALVELLTILEEAMAGPIEHIQELLAPFMEVQTPFMSIVKNVKESWALLLQGYKDARMQLDLIFGPKFHKEFPRKYLESSSCGDGFYESTGNGYYEHPGVDAVHEEMQLNEDVTTPLEGIIHVNSSSQVVIYVEGMNDVMLIMDNVQALEEFAEYEGQLVAAGEVIGTLLSAPGCDDLHIHLSMRKLSDGGYIDPSRYMERRKMQPPKWEQHCGHYLLIYKGDTITAGSIPSREPEPSDESKEIDSLIPDVDDFPPIDISVDIQKKRSVLDETGSKIVDKLTDFTAALGFNITSIKELFNININDVGIEDILNVLEAVGMTELKDKISNILYTIEEMTNNEECVRPDSMDDDQLKFALIQRGKDPEGSTQTLIDRYLESDAKCFSLQPKLRKNMYCTFDDACLSMSCCADVEFLVYRHAFMAYMTVDPCSLTLSVGFGEWSHVVDLNVIDEFIENSDPVFAEMNLLNMAQLVAYYRIEMDGFNINVSLGVAWCSAIEEKCDNLILLLDSAVLTLIPCDGNMPGFPTIELPDIEVPDLPNIDIPNIGSPNLPNINLPSLPSINGLKRMSLGNFWKFLDNIGGIDESMLKDLSDGLRIAFKEWMMRRINTVLNKIFGDEFERFDLCAKGIQFEFGPYKTTFVSVTVPIPLGPIPCYFKFQLDGYFGANFHCTVCVMSMKATITVSPAVGSSALGEFGIDVGFLTASLRLTAYILTTSFPTKAEIQFNKFPLDVSARMDLELIPLSIKLHANLIFGRTFKVWRKTVNLKIVMINKLLWHYQTSGINKNIFNINNIEKDDSPPAFEMYSKAIEIKKDYEGKTNSTVEAKRQKRSFNNKCHVEQIRNRHYLEPGFNIEVAASDDKSSVTMTYRAGTYPGGDDVIRDEPMGGASTIVLKNLLSGRKLYFTVIAKNSQGDASQATCELHTYDTTPPTGRVTMMAMTTSHPRIIRTSVFAVDDSEIVDQKIAVGYSRGQHGWQEIDWQDIASHRMSEALMELRAKGIQSQELSLFTSPIKGRLISQSFLSTQHTTVQSCAKECLKYEATKCLSFCYDYSDTRTCELFEAIEGHGTELHELSGFHYFERIGIGQTSVMEYQHLSLQHGSLVYSNVYLRNILGYETIMTSTGIIVDLTPPSAVLKARAQKDILFTEPCTSFTPLHVQHRCMEQTPLPNYRFIIDDAGCGIVFNGDEQLVDKMYSKANNHIAANWDGINDNETGVLLYTWSVGRSPCADDIHPHKDPHAHLFDASSWTHVGVAYPLMLEDGPYHVTVRALSDVEFGGPMALTVCHSTPYIIDTVPPIIYQINSVNYDEDTLEISAVLNATDESSGIDLTELGLGRSRRDTTLLDYTSVQNTDIVKLIYKLPDGVATWIKVRVTDKVGHRAAGHSNKPVMVDLSPPINGNVYDGQQKRRDIDFQSSVTQMCASWDGFYDPESGISLYQVCLGSSPGLANAASLVNLTYDTSIHCFDNLVLVHKQTYFVTVIAWNGGMNERSSSSSSNGVFIDITPPHDGDVTDGGLYDQDINFTSNAATVEASWNGFEDPESGKFVTKLIIHRKHGGSDNETVLHVENVGDVHTVARHHFHLHHDDFVRSEITVMNNALLETSATSDGFTVDLTDPQMRFLYDGLDPTADPKFTQNPNELSANWDFFDPESDIKLYHLTVYEYHGGKKNQFYPSPIKSKDHFVQLPGTISIWSSGPILQLISGVRYEVQVSAVNWAGLTAVHHTSGVIPDTTPPKVLYVHAGVMQGESEEVIEGVVLQSDPHGIVASWNSVDAESGITDVLVCVGTQPDRCDIRAWESYPTKKDGYLDNIDLELTHNETGLPLYYVSVTSVNGAGANSTVKSSSPIKLVPEDKEGIVLDGAEVFDVDYQLNSNMLTVSFAGFESAQHGIAQHEVAVGTRPKHDDVFPFTTDAIISEDVNGIGSEGQAQFAIGLEAGQQYYVSIRAITGANNALDSSSDGIIIDTTSPVASIEMFGDVSTHPEAWSNSSVVYQRDENSVPGRWTALDEQSEVHNIHLAIGDYPGCRQHDLSVDSSSSTITNNAIKPAKPGIPNVLTLTATNAVGLYDVSVSSSAVVDITAPNPGEVTCPRFIAVGCQVSCEWTVFKEVESEVDHYLFGLGMMPGDIDIMNFTKLPPSQLSYTFQDIESYHQAEVYATVVAVNKVNLHTQATSDTMVVDTTPPIGEWVIELTDIAPIGSQASSICPETEDFCLLQDAICQLSLSQVVAAWAEFSDPETGILSYEIGVGSLPGSTNLHEFHDAPLSRHHIISGLDLTDVRQVFVTVKGYNTAGLFSTITSNGVYISRISSGMTPLGDSFVYDGLQEKDLEYVDTHQQLSAHWDFSGDPCPSVAYEVTVRRVDEREIVQWQTLPPEQVFARYDELPISDGETYYFIVRSTNELGYTYSLRSNGATVRQEPPLPGFVRDGNIPGMDLNYQLSLTILSANWDGFGYDKNVDTFDKNDIDGDIGPHQIISYYEVAAGSDRRYPLTRTNIHPFINVANNHTWVFEHLDLIAKTATYYVTVRAYAMSTARVEVTSNGIKVGYGGQVISVGTIELPRFLPSTNAITILWKNFKFSVPVKFYEIGITSKKFAIDEDCGNFLHNRHGISQHYSNISEIFDVLELENLGLNTALMRQNLQMVHGKEYQVVVMATDESGMCSSAAAPVTVDVTKPIKGHIIVGEYHTRDVFYVQALDTLHVTWSGYSDDESGISHQEIALYITKCAGNSDDIIDYEIEQDYETLPNDTESFLFLNLLLLEDKIYEVRLRVINNAGLVTESRSHPVLLDLVDPVSGSVHNGGDFTLDLKYQSVTDSLTASLLYLPSARGSACPDQYYTFHYEHTDWMPLYHGNIHGIPDHKLGATECHGVQVKYNEHNGLSLKAERKNSEQKMRVGCLQSTTSVLQNEVYKFDVLVPSANFTVVTSVTFWDGPKGLPVDMDDNNITHLASDEYHILEDPVDQDTFIESFDDDFSDHKGFGFQIHKDKEVNQVTSDWLILWSANEDIIHRTMYDMGPGFASSWHSYELRAQFEDDHTDIELDTSTLKLYVDGHLRNLLSGAPFMRNDVRVTLLTRTYQDFLPDVHDMFNPPAAQSHFKHVRFPADKSAICRYGEVFRGGSQPIVEFQAGIGTSKDETDVMNFTMVTSPCIPCSGPCNVDQTICDPNCNNDALQLLKFTIDNLDLVPVTQGNDLGANNETASLPAPYYVLVQGITGSGRNVMTSTEGIYIDTTPPTIQSITHIDVEWDQDEPSRFQGNNHTIAIYIEVDDLESPISMLEWAIGSTPGGDNIQPFTLSEQQEFAANYELDGVLNDTCTYYATVRYTNEAGLTSSLTSDGVTVLLSVPDVANTSTSLPGTTPLGQDAVQSSSQDELNVAWGEPADENVDTVYVGLGTDDSSSDIYPDQLVGLNNSGKVHIGGDGMMPEDTEGELMRKRREIYENLGSNSTLSTEFHMEPGRILHANIKACSPAHQCGSIPVKQVMILRPDIDKVAVMNDQRLLELILYTAVNVTTMQDQTNECSLAGGLLSTEDLVSKYQSEVSDTFKPYIVSPEATLQRTDRHLRNRLIARAGQAFFLTSTCSLDGPLSVTAKFATSAMEYGVKEPILLAWCANSEQWVDVTRSCLAQQSDTEWLENTVTTEVCSLQSLCDVVSLPIRQKISQNELGLSGPVLFMVAAVSVGFFNTPPYFTSANKVYMMEDSGTKRMRLTAIDDEGDDFEILLHSTKTWSGHASLTADNWLTYRPCDNCNGIDIVHIYVVEKRTDGEDASMTSSKVVFNITAINDHPRLLIIQNGHNILTSSFLVEFLVEEISLSYDLHEDRDIILISYDPDESDFLHILLDKPSHGELVKYSQIQNINFISNDCLTFVDNLTGIIAQLKGLQSAIAIPMPCGLPDEVLASQMAWVITLITYRPFESFYGQDTFKVIASDQTDALSDLVTIDMFVLESPCRNGATCIGPKDDLDCSGKGRADGFTYYSCLCPAGYVGDFCEDDYDECLSSPCPDNFTCIDHVNNFTCECTLGLICEPSKPSPVSTDTWKYAVIAVGLLVPLCVAMVILYVCYRKTKAVQQSDKELNYRLSQASFLSQISLLGKNRVSPTPSEFINPTFGSDASLDTSPADAGIFDIASFTNDNDPEVSPNADDNMKKEELEASDALEVTENPPPVLPKAKKAPWSSVRLAWVSGWRVYPQDTEQNEEK